MILRIMIMLMLDRSWCYGIICSHFLFCILLVSYVVHTITVTIAVWDHSDLLRKSFKCDLVCLIAHDRKSNFFDTITKLLYLSTPLDVSVRLAYDIWSAFFFCPLVIRSSSLGPSWCHRRPIVSCVCLLCLVVLANNLWCSSAIIVHNC